MTSPPALIAPPAGPDYFVADAAPPLARPVAAGDGTEGPDAPATPAPEPPGFPDIPELPGGDDGDDRPAPADAEAIAAP